MLVTDGPFYIWCCAAILDEANKIYETQSWPVDIRNFSYVAIIVQKTWPGSDSYSVS